MKTQNDADAWLGQQVGQHLDYDHQYGMQCFDFYNFYYEFITGDGPYADGYAVEGAKDIWDVPTDFFDKIPDSRTLVPSVGDVLIYGPSWGGGYGHVEVCRWSDADGCHVIGENEHGNPSEGVVEVYRSWANMRGLIGVERPRFAPEPQQEVPNEPTPPAPIQTDPVPTPPSQPPVETTTETPQPTPSPTEEPSPVPTPDPAPAEPTPPKPPVKVVVPEPTYFKIWELIVAILKKLFKKG